MQKATVEFDFGQTEATPEALKEWLDTNPFGATVSFAEGFSEPANDEAAPADPAVGETVADVKPEPECKAA